MKSALHEEGGRFYMQGLFWLGCRNTKIQNQHRMNKGWLVWDEISLALPSEPSVTWISGRSFADAAHILCHSQHTQHTAHTAHSTHTCHSQHNNPSHLGYDTSATFFYGKQLSVRSQMGICQARQTINREKI